MKKVIVFLVLLVLSVPAVTAVDLVAGPELGLSHNFSFGSDFRDALDVADTHSELKVGFSIGAFLEIGLSPSFAIQPELLYTTSGYKVKDLEDLTMRFIELDALLKARFGAYGDVGFRVFAGPDVRFGVGDWTLKVHGSPAVNISASDVADDLKIPSTYFGVVVGAGLTFDGVGNGRLGIEARGTIGLQNLDDTGSYEQKIAAIGLMLTYGFPTERT